MRRMRRTHSETAECAIEHAVSVKIDFVTVGSFQESEVAGSIGWFFYGPDRLRLSWCFTCPCRRRNMILQLPPRMLEGVIDGK